MKYTLSIELDTETGQLKLGGSCPTPGFALGILAMATKEYELVWAETRMQIERAQAMMGKSKLHV